MQTNREVVKRAIERNEMIEIFNSPNGGFIAAPANSIMPETPIENISSLYHAIDKYSKLLNY